MNLTNPTQLSPNLDPGVPTRPNKTQILTLGAQQNPKLGSFGFIKYIIGLNPNLNPIWGQLDPIGPLFDPEGQPDLDSIRILGPKLGSTWKSGSGLAALRSRP